MSWKLPSRAFKISLGTLSASRGLHLIRFGRHVSYIILVNDAASEGSVEVLFPSMRFSFVCHEYWRMTHMHHDGWNLKFEHRGVCLWDDYFLCGVDDMCNGVWICG